MKRVLLVTTNKYKAGEYREVFSKYGIRVTTLCCDPSEYTWDDAVFAGDPDLIAVMADTNNLYHPSTGAILTDLSSYRGPVTNMCDLTVMTSDRGVQTYLGSVEGRVSDPVKDQKEVFGWDGHFVPTHLKDSLHDLKTKGFKTSARQQALASFVSQHLTYKGEKILRWFNVTSPHDKIALLTEAHSVQTFVRENPYISKTTGFVRELADRAVHEGVFFRHATSRRVGNYWLPGLNGGLPFTQKKDPVHEITFLFHDLMHHLTPDLVFDGSTSPTDAKLYMTWRLMSEAYSLVLADMLFVHELTKMEGVVYDWSKRAIYPLYLAMLTRGDKLTDILRHVVTYITTGETSQFPPGEAALNFATKYEPFFSGDWRWTKRNWEALCARKTFAEAWVNRVGGAPMFRSVGLFTLSDARSFLDVRESDTVSEMATKIMTFWNWRLFVGKSPVKGTALGNAHRRYLLGQVAVYARYKEVVNTEAGLEMILEVIRKESPTPADLEGARMVLKTYLTMLKDFNAISPADALMYHEVYPHFDPFFVDYDNGAQPSLKGLLAEMF